MIKRMNKLIWKDIKSLLLLPNVPFPLCPRHNETISLSILYLTENLFFLFLNGPLGQLWLTKWGLKICWWQYLLQLAFVSPGNRLLSIPTPAFLGFLFSTTHDGVRRVKPTSLTHSLSPTDVNYTVNKNPGAVKKPRRHTHAHCANVNVIIQCQRVFLAFTPYIINSEK